jgi:hypothetical protein
VQQKGKDQGPPDSMQQQLVTLPGQHASRYTASSSPWAAAAAAGAAVAEAPGAPNSPVCSCKPGSVHTQHSTPISRVEAADMQPNLGSSTGAVQVLHVDGLQAQMGAAAVRSPDAVFVVEVLKQLPGLQVLQLFKCRYLEDEGQALARHCCGRYSPATVTYR